MDALTQRALARLETYSRLREQEDGEGRTRDIAYEVEWRLDDLASNVTDAVTVLQQRIRAMAAQEVPVTGEQLLEVDVLATGVSTLVTESIQECSQHLSNVHDRTSELHRTIRELIMKETA